jgi:hypothetical protein
LGPEEEPIVIGKKVLLERLESEDGGAERIDCRDDFLDLELIRSETNGEVNQLGLLVARSHTASKLGL